MTKSYNGHHCWNCWNVAQWICNDEGLYLAAIECKVRPRSRGYLGPSAPRWAAHRFISEVVGEGARTPDGARYTLTAVRSALAGLE